MRLHGHGARTRGDLLLGLSDGAYRDTQGAVPRTLRKHKPMPIAVPRGPTKRSSSTSGSGPRFATPAGLNKHA